MPVMQGATARADIGLAHVGDELAVASIREMQRLPDHIHHRFTENREGRVTLAERVELDAPAFAAALHECGAPPIINTRKKPRKPSAKGCQCEALACGRGHYPGCPAFTGYSSIKKESHESLASSPAHTAVSSACSKSSPTGPSDTTNTGAGRQQPKPEEK
jgi:hypothetical protein